jgi:hypothetical protein
MMDVNERAAQIWASRNPKYDQMRDYVCIFRIPKIGGTTMDPTTWVAPTDERLANHLAMMLLPDGFIPVIREVLATLQGKGMSGAGEVIALEKDLPRLESALLFPDDSYGIRVYDAVSVFELQGFLPPKFAATLRHPSSQSWWAWK